MDREQFDALARRVWTRQSRRAAVATLLGAALLGHAPAPTSAKLLAKRKRNGKKRKKGKKNTRNRPCYTNTDCIPGQGKDNAGCDFTFSTVFRDRDARGSHLGHSNLRGADLRGADLRGADLGGACLVGASLEGAKLGASVDLGGAIFCNTTMPDGTSNDSGCGQTTACCPPLEQDCPDGVINCYHTESDGCTISAGLLSGRVGTCYQFPMCCPCEHNDQGYWSEQCNAFIHGCAGKCTALLEQTLGGCFRCAGPP